MNEENTKNDRIELKSTYRGLIGSYVACFITILVMAIVTGTIIRPLKNYKASMYEKYNVSSYSEFEEFDNRHYSKVSVDDEMNVELSIVGIILCRIVFGIILLVCLFIVFVTNNYRAKMVNIIDKEIGKIICFKYGFPYSRTITELQLARIIKVTVEQGSIARLYDTGTLVIEALTVKCADAETTTWRIPYIEKPNEAKRRILDGLPEYSVVRVQAESQSDS